MVIAPLNIVAALHICLNFNGRHLIAANPSLPSSNDDKRNFQSLPQILRRVADPVEALDFKFVQNDLPPPVSDDIRDGFREGTDLIGQMNEGLTNVF